MVGGMTFWGTILASQDEPGFSYVPKLEESFLVDTSTACDELSMLYLYAAKEIYQQFYGF
jgi:hypothetical protein